MSFVLSSLQFVPNHKLHPSSLDIEYIFYRQESSIKLDAAKKSSTVEFSFPCMIRSKFLLCIVQTTKTLEILSFQFCDVWDFRRWSTSFSSSFIIAFEITQE